MAETLCDADISKIDDIVNDCVGEVCVDLFDVGVTDDDRKNLEGYELGVCV